MNGPPKMSEARITSKVSEGQAFWCLTSIPSLARSVVARIPGHSPSWTSVLAVQPEALTIPRGRWYLNEREKIRWPCA